MRGRDPSPDGSLVLQHVEVHLDRLRAQRVAFPGGHARNIVEPGVEAPSVSSPEGLELEDDVRGDEPTPKVTAVDVLADEVVAFGRVDEEDGPLPLGLVLEDLEEPLVLVLAESPELEEVREPIGT